MYHPKLAVTRQGQIAIVTFDRPEVLNAFDLSMWRGLQHTVEALSADDDLRCVVLRGAGERAFSAGADIGAFEVERGTDEREEEYARVLDDSMQSIRHCRHPVVAMIMGHCLGGGAVAAEILIEGRIFNGREAYEKGLLSRVVPDAAVEAEAMALAERICLGAPLSARYHKAAIRKLRGPLPITPEDDRATSDFRLTGDFKNACKSFMAKQKPVFHGH